MVNRKSFDRGFIFGCIFIVSNTWFKFLTWYILFMIFEELSGQVFQGVLGS